jgi:hypothetical protein
VVAGAPGSEGTLGYLIATAAPGSAPLGARYERVRELRTAGGSWGIVAAIVRAEVTRVGAALSALLEPGTVPVLAGGPLDVAPGLGPSGAFSSPDGQPGDSAGPGRRGDERPAPPDGGGPRPSPSPTQTPGPDDPVSEVVDEVVDTVLDIVSPSPSSAPLLTVQLPLPLPLPLRTPLVPLLR